MTGNREGFLTGLKAEPDKDGLALIFADWLDENGDANLAGFIRIHVEYQRLDRGDQSEDARAVWKKYYDAIRQREQAFFKELDLPEHASEGVNFGYRHGLAHSLSIPVQWLLKGEKIIEADNPLLTRLTVGRVNGWGERLAQCALLQRMEHLTIEAWISPEDAQAIATSPHLKQLQSLRIWLGNSEGDDTANLAAFAEGAVSTYPDLKELWIIDVPACGQETIDAANRIAGRPIAKAVIPAPRLYPIEGDFGLYLSAGHLPDGTQVLVDSPTRDRSSARLFRFSPEGLQGEMEEIQMPPDSQLLPEDKGLRDTTAQLREYLQREMDFKLGTIWVQGLDDPDHEYSIYDCPNHVDGVGRPDDPAFGPEDDEYPMGNASEAAYWYGEYRTYVFDVGHNDWFVNSDGHVESS